MVAASPAVVHLWTVKLRWRFGRANRGMPAHIESARSYLKACGLRPAFFERTAWDLAFATQSLVYIDADLVGVRSADAGVRSLLP
jgi:hypothetical protein